MIYFTHGSFVRVQMDSITKTRLYNFDPLQPHFYIVKLGFAGVYIIFLISAQKHRLWVLVRTASARRFYRVPTIYVLSRNMKNIRVFHLKIFQFLEGKFSTYLNRCVFVMLSSQEAKAYTFANSADHNERSNQGLHCLPYCYRFLTETLFAITDESKFRDEIVHLRNSGVKGRLSVFYSPYDELIFFFTKHLWNLLTTFTLFAVTLSYSVYLLGK